MIGLTKKEAEEIKKEIETSTRPLIFFHDDADGLASFLLLRKEIPDAKGIVIKSHPEVNEKYLHRIEENSPDKIFIVDLAMVTQEFIDKAKTPIIWIDHHEPQNRKGVKYYNPRTRGAECNAPASYLCHQATKNNLWIAMTGIVGDWFLPPDISKEFSKKYPKLLNTKIKKPQTALFKSKIGTLAKIFNFILKGNSSDAMKYVRILSRITDPFELLEKRNPHAKYLMKKYERYEKEYQYILKKAKEQKSNKKILLFTYPSSQTSFTGDLSNELLFLYPNKIIAIARESNNEMKCSLRSGPEIILNKTLEITLKEFDGHGGGHEHACGCCIKTKDFKRFIEKLEKNIVKKLK